MEHRRSAVSSSCFLLWFTVSFSKIDRRYCLDLSNAINRLETRNTTTYVLLRSQLNPFAAAAATLLYPGLQGFSLSSVLEGKELNFE